MMTSGSWAHDVAQAGGEGQPDLRIHVDLIDPVHLIFHGIFDGDDLFVGLIDALERGIQRGRFTAPRGAGDQQNSVRQRRVIFHARKHVVSKPSRSRS